MTERELVQLVGRVCLWTPHLSDEMGVHARIADAVLTPTDEILVLLIPLGVALLSILYLMAVPATY